MQTLTAVQNEKHLKFDILCRQLTKHCENVEDLEADFRSAANMRQIVAITLIHILLIGLLAF